MKFSRFLKQYPREFQGAWCFPGSLAEALNASLVLDSIKYTKYIIFGENSSRIMADRVDAFIVAKSNLSVNS
jgi:dienelactone hydrolase